MSADDERAFKARYALSPVVGLLAAGFCALAFARMESSDRIGIGVVFVSVGIGSIAKMLFQDRRYVVGKDFVRIHRGPFRRHLALASIRWVMPTDLGENGVIKTKRLALRDARGHRLAIVQPEDPAEFVAALDAARHAGRAGADGRAMEHAS